VVFVLDRKTEQSPGSFARASFSSLYREFADKRKSDAFSDRTELVLQSLREGNESAYGAGQLISVDAKDGAGLRASYDSQSRSITGRLTQIERKKEIDLAIEELRDEQSELNQERVLAVRLAEACSGLEANAQWTELERTGEEAIFVRLRGVYSMRSKNTEFSETTDRVSDLELARAERSRNQILKSLHDLAK
jgi:YD repeat-containing protein